jgi:hypothetical protein
VSEIPIFEDYLSHMCGAERVHKIGEGLYKEVFGVADADSVLSVMPIDGDLVVNSEPQKSAAEILPEVRIQLELSKLSDTPSQGRGQGAPQHDVSIADRYVGLPGALVARHVYVRCS